MHGEPMRYLSLCCIAKNEDPFIGEWLTYHSLLGAEHFYVYDNESARPLLAHPAVARYKRAGRLTLVRTAGKAPQYQAYWHCLETFGRESHWMGFLDLDEFVCFAGERRDGGFVWLDMRPLLSEFEDYAALALNWRQFTSSGHIRHPEGLVIENYRNAWPVPATVEFHVKHFVRPALVEKITNPHLFLFRQGYFAVTEEHRPMPPGWPWTPVSRKRAWINHYYYKSREDFEHKLERGRADIGGRRDESNREAFDAQAVMRGKEEGWAANYAPLVKKYEHSLPPEMPAPDNGESLPGYLRLCRETLDYRQGGPWAPFYDGHAPSRAEKYNRAEALLCKALEKYSDDVQFWVTRAWLARMQSKFRQAAKFLDKALALKQAPPVYEEMFHLALAEGRREDAENILFYLKNPPKLACMEQNAAKRLAVYENMLRTRATF
jgi:hypothetical protein